MRYDKNTPDAQNKAASEIEYMIVMLRALLKDHPFECLCVVCLNDLFSPFFCEIIEGDSFYSITVPARKILEIATEHNSSMIILVHNHPSGSCIPSMSDVVLTRYLLCYLATYGITLIEHIIVSKLCCYAMMRVRQIA